jgi:hypothetical protein
VVITFFVACVSYTDGRIDERALLLPRSTIDAVENGDYLHEGTYHE